jgi:MoaA/NifB/PqqE/SkfB family radical SAM enzyme
MRSEGRTGEQIKGSPAARGFGIRDGHGIVFVSHTGEICPAGFLPVAAGNVRTHRLADVYRNAPLFRSLHDPGRFEDRCGGVRIPGFVWRLSREGFCGHGKPARIGPALRP